MQPNDYPSPESQPEQSIPKSSSSTTHGRKNPSRARWFLITALVLYVIWTIISLFLFAYHSGVEGTAISVGEIFYYLFSSLITPVIIFGFYFAWKSFIASSRQLPENAQQTNPESKIRRSIGWALCLLAVFGPVYIIYNFFANPSPGSEFFVLGLPIFAVPIIFGLLGIRQLYKHHAVSKVSLAAPLPSKHVGSQIVNGLIYGAIFIVIAACLWIGYIFYVLQTYESEDSKPRTVSLTSALERIQYCGVTVITVKQSKKADPSKGIVYHPSDGTYVVYDDAVWPQLAAAAEKVSGTPVNAVDTCPPAEITPR